MATKQRPELSSEVKQAMLAAIVKTSDDVIISETPEGIITSWNQAAEKMFGYTEDEAIGKHISLIVPKSKISTDSSIFKRIASGEKVHHVETIRLSKFGREIPVLLSVSPLIDAHGRMIGVSKIVRDLNARINDDLKQARLAAIIDSSDDTIVSKTLDGIIMSWNKSAEKMFGYTEAEALGKHISIIIPPERIDEETFIINKIKSGEKVDHFETYRMGKDKVLRPISLTVSPILNFKGEIIGASKIARDISEQVRAKTEAIRLYKEIKALNEKKDEFIGLASHELKTPLSTISAYLQILDRMITEGQGKKFIGKALDQLRKLTSLVDDLLDISMIEAGKLQLRKERFDMRVVIENAIDLLRHSSSHHTISLQTAVSDFLIEADPHRLEQVLINLLTNAIKYSPNGNHIDVSLTADDKLVSIAVKDDGDGIHPNKTKMIFSRFYRAEENNPNTSGLGMGLFLSQQIVQAHGGEIWVESKLGEGSTFYFTIPLAGGTE